MLEFDPRQRLKPLDALSHKFFKKMNDESTNTSAPAAILNPGSSLTSHGLAMQPATQVDPRSHQGQQPVLACGVPQSVGVALQLPPELTSKPGGYSSNPGPILGNPQQSPAATQNQMGQISSMTSNNTASIIQQHQPRNKQQQATSNIASLPTVISVAPPPSGTPSNSSSAIESQPLFDFNIQVSGNLILIFVQ